MVQDAKYLQKSQAKTDKQVIIMCKKTHGEKKMPIFPGC
jgi:hypothetical protein